MNREIKAYCPDFTPIRRALRDVGAMFTEVKEQVDTFYHLPQRQGNEGTRRLKLRVEGGQRQLIYYYDRQEHGARTSRFQLWEVSDTPLKEILDRTLGVCAVVRKSRELWRRENVIFNLDTVEGVGQVFEVEVQFKEGYDLEEQVQEYRRRFGPYLGEEIAGSNEDLVGVGL